tara:strand:+ start:391 stop:939 length:549 start_codon:yes stop_codon:yes gene_type:complete
MALGLGTSIASGSTIDHCTYLKAIYDTDQTSQSGIRLDDQFPGITAASGDTWTMTCNIYLTGSSGTWDADSGVVATTFNLGGTSKIVNISQNTLTAIDQTSSALDAGWDSNDHVYVYFYTASSYPDDGATIYISDWKIVIKDSGGSIKATNIYDFSSGGDISMVGDWSMEGALTKTKGNCLP